MRILSVLCVSLLALACSDSDDETTQDAGTGLRDAASPDRMRPDLRPDMRKLKLVFGGKRPAELTVPSSYDGSKAVPLVVLLHGYSTNGWTQARYLGFEALAHKEGFLLIAPDGMTDSKSNRFWNATDACCGVKVTAPDDVAYISSLVAEIKKEYLVDAKRVYAIGHSNGGFMSFRLACDRADMFAAVISLAGATWADKSKCKPSSKVSVVQVHGDKDDVVKFAGGSITHLGGKVAYPSAHTTVSHWASYNGCTGKFLATGEVWDLDLAAKGKETVVKRYAQCPTGVDVELWVMQGTTHVPVPQTAFAEKTWDFFKRHPKTK